ncbi:hypothetical protein Q3W71_17640 [Micromonospora sp. C28SCA-DRY-2]|uniref:hypothetical protein n=1 Tax=Micromonospora sp. C28SCA-DRY-2 TaxID=3059522 RepID=UPI0026754F77|nr:hypothetical protein [Micromonospora sp. C28SCA-DRY-2]MDO3703496.1 hypothetical protein [Micromonospora sp. C28SCA-DRY-2]
MPDPLFAGLYRDTEQLTWASAEQLRGRARQLSRRRAAAVLAGVAAVAVVAAGTVALAGRPDAAPRPVPPATGSPTPSVAPTLPPAPWPAPDPDEPPVEEAAMLQPGDVTAGYRPTGAEADEDGSFGSRTVHCLDPTHPLRRHVPPRAEREQTFQRGADELIFERVQRHLNTNRVLLVVRATVEVCRDEGVALTVLEDVPLRSPDQLKELLVVRVDHAGGGSSLHVFVAAGEMLAEVWGPGLIDPAEAGRLAQRATERLCDVQLYC